MATIRCKFKQLSRTARPVSISLLDLGGPQFGLPILPVTVQYTPLIADARNNTTLSRRHRDPIRLTIALSITKSNHSSKPSPPSHDTAVQSFRGHGFAGPASAAGFTSHQSSIRSIHRCHPFGFISGSRSSKYGGDTQRGGVGGKFAGCNRF